MPGVQQFIEGGPSVKAAFEQGNTLRPRAQGYGVQLDGVWYRLAANSVSPLRIGTKDSLAERLDQRGSTDENVLDIGYAFSRNNLTGGEGLDWFPRVSQLGQPAPLDVIRYWDSHNLQIQRPAAGQPYTITLSEANKTFYTPATTPVDLATSADFIYVAWGTQIDWFKDWNDNTPEGTQDFGTDVKLVVANPGDEVFVLTDNGHLWYKPWDESVFTEVYDLTGAGFNDQPLTNIWIVKGRLVAERIGLDTEGSFTGTVELVVGTPVGIGDPTAPTWTLEFFALDTARGRFRRVIDAGIAVVAIVSDGSIRSYVPQADTGGGDPTLTIRGRTDVAISEQPLSIGFANGFVVFLTTSDEDETAGRHTIRAYQAQVLDERSDFIVGNMQLLRTWSGAAEPPSPTKNMPATRDHIFWTVEEEAGSDYLWAFDTVTTGVARLEDFGADVTALIVFDSRGGAILGDSVITSDIDHYHSAGYLITPNINFGLNTEINWTEAVLEASNLDGTKRQVKLSYSTNPDAIQDPLHPSWRTITYISHDTQQGIPIPMYGVRAKSLTLKIDIESTNGNTHAPVVTRFAIRGMPQHRDWIVEVPINVSDIISAPGRMPYRLAGYGDIVHRRLLNLSGINVECIVLEPPIHIQGIVDTVLEPVEYVSDRGSSSRYLMVRVRGNKIDTSGTGLATNQGLGIAALGISLLGVAHTDIEEIGA